MRFKQWNPVERNLVTIFTIVLLMFIITFVIGCNNDTSTFVPATPPPSNTNLNRAAGLSCALYDMSASPISELPNFNPSASQTVLNGQPSAGVAIANFPMVGVIDFTTSQAMLAGSGYGASTNYALDCTGYFDSETMQGYTLSLTSDDGSKLLIDGLTVLANDGVHGATTVNSNVAVTQGTHSIELQYFQGPGNVTLILLSSVPLEFHQ